MPAARRRDRRGAGGRDQPTQPREGRSTVRSRSLSISLLSTSLLLLLLAVVAIAALFIVYRGDESGIEGTAPTSLSVYERGLVNPNLDYHEILAENSRFSENTSRRHFPNPVLAYVTPWNSRGYEMAKLFGSKLTHLSPIWYELKSEGKKLVLEGRHNVDKEWISELWNNGHPLVLPRVVLEASPTDLLLKKKQWNRAIDIIIKECKDMGYDGVVLESWSRWAAYGILHDPDLRNMALDFIKQLGEALHSVDLTRRNDDHKLELIYVIPAPRSPNFNEYDFGPQDLQQLCDAVDGFSLMTYDFSGPQSPGPNAPLNWVRTSLNMLVGDSDAQNHARKILLGLNFYGNDFLIPEAIPGMI